MRQTHFSGIIKRRFLHSIQRHQLTVPQIVEQIGVPPGHLCRLIADQNIRTLPLITYNRIAHWLKMPLANILTLCGIHPKLDDMVKLGMEAQGYRPTSTKAQRLAASDAGISVAVFRRALHGYADFTPSEETCDRLAKWLKWTHYEPDDIAAMAGMIVRYQPDGIRVVISPSVAHNIKPYPCACGRPGCMVPSHIPTGPRRKWRNDACRMWAKRRAQKNARQRYRPEQGNDSTLPHHTPIVRFIAINERSVPVRF